jgi:hypothetical protein
MLHVFYLGVAYVCKGFQVFFSVSKSCCKYVFQIFLLFQTYIASVLSECCICCSGYTYMLQAYVPNMSSVLDVCCSKSSMLQAFHKAQVISMGWASAGGHSRANRCRHVAWRGRATAGRARCGEQQDGNACSDARPCVGTTRESAWETTTRCGTCRRGMGAEMLMSSSDPFWPLVGPADILGRRAPLAVRPHVR